LGLLWRDIVKDLPLLAQVMSVCIGLQSRVPLQPVSIYANETSHRQKESGSHASPPFIHFKAKEATDIHQIL
jgi:hypothetical protein